MASLLPESEIPESKNPMYLEMKKAIEKKMEQNQKSLLKRINKIFYIESNAEEERKEICEQFNKTLQNKDEPFLKHFPIDMQTGKTIEILETNDILKVIQKLAVCIFSFNFIQLLEMKNKENNLPLNSLEDIAFKTKINISTLKEYATYYPDSNLPSVMNAILLANYFDVDLNHLFDYDYLHKILNGTDISVNDN